jgi:NADH-quinone oxidoreductase subunit G
MAVIYIENKRYETPEGRNLLDACLSLGFDIPYFCWHPALGSVGACRQCAVRKYRDEKDTKGCIVMSCMEQVTDGLRISIDDPEVRQFRAAVIEWLMTSHPHDCPVCDEGGECHLQDMTVMSGHAYRRFRFKKRTHENQQLGPFINHEMNRCIQCYRCVRFYRDYAGGRDFNVFSSHHHVYFGRHDHGVLESEFSGNLVEVCPTGVFTDKTLEKHYTRKWDLQTAPSVCVHCGLGCNIIAGERYGTLRRILNRYNGAVNGYFLCDRGRFGYEFVNDAHRFSCAMKRNSASGRMEPVDKANALGYIKKMSQKGRIIGIGSPRASVESNYALRILVGAENFYSGMSSAEHRLALLSIQIMKSGCCRIPSLKETEHADAVLVLGEDVTNIAPMLALSLRQSVKNRAAAALNKKNIPSWNNGPLCEIVGEEAGPLFIATPYPTKLDEAATHAYRGTPLDIARLGFAVARAIDGTLPPVPGLGDRDAKLAEDIACELSKASNPLIVSGAGCMSEAVLQAASNAAGALSAKNRNAGLFLTAPECNTFGLALADGQPLEDAFRTAETEAATTAIILENDLYRRAGRNRVDAFFEHCMHVVVIDCIETASSARAEIILPAAPFSCAEGTLVNNEGRGQRFYRVMDPEGDVAASWHWLADIMEARGMAEADQLRSLDGMISALAKDMPAFSDIKDIAPPAGFRTHGRRIPRQPHRYSGRTSMNAQVNVHEQKPAPDADSPLSFSMEGFRGVPPSPFIPFYWSPGWNSVQALNKFQEEIGGPLRGGDPGLRIVSSSSGGFEYFRYMPEPQTQGIDEWLIVPYSRIFGSEELSARSSSVGERIQPAFLLLNDTDAKRIGAGNGSMVSMEISDARVKLALRIEAGIPSGIACYPLGFPGIEFIDLPAKGRIKEEG